jgi:hypothetical protein
VNPSVWAAWLRGLRGWQVMTIAVLAIVAVALGGLVLVSGTPPSPSPSASATPAPSTATSRPSASPTTAPTATLAPSPTLAGFFSPLDGMGVADAATASRLAVAVMIDDNVVARPQSGFNAASIVYQAPADGGEDRYMLVFQELDGPDVGPVRSGRPYFVRWASEYRAAFGHFGGDEKTRFQVIPSLDGKYIWNLDGIGSGGPAYHRITSRDPPHNAYTNTAALLSQAGKLGAPAAIPSDVGQRPFKEDAPAADRPASASIDVPYGRGSSSYAYDPASNAYARSVAGKAQIDAADGKPVTARNVVVLFMRLSIDPESEAGYARPVLDQVGSGKAIVFREGKAIVGTWKKPDNTSLTRFYDADGNEVPLVRGRIFIQVVPTGTDVTYK